jgi:thioredoxin 1
MGAVIEVTKENFQEHVRHGTVLVDVWGPSCKPCLALMPHVERLAAECDGLTVIKLEAPKARRLCMELKVMGLPAFLLFRDGTEVGRLARPEISPQELREWLDGLLKGGDGDASR